MSTPRKPRVFLSRTTTGLAALADEIAAILIERGVEPIIQTGFLPDWRNVPQMLQDKLHSCDSVIALIGPVHGGEPEREPARLKDPRTHGRNFSFTQWEYLVARDLQRPTFTFLVSGDDLIAPFEKESDDLEKRQQRFIADFPKDRTSLYYEYTGRAKLLDYIRRMELPINVSAGLPHNLPAPIGSLFIGREDFLADLGKKLTAGDATVIRGKQAIHGMGGVGKTRAAIEYGWAHAADYNALLFVTADSPEALERNLADLCGPLVLNLPEQDARETEIQIAAVLRWLAQNPGWFLVIDNVDTPEAREAVAQLTAQIPHGHILITSRLADWPAGFTALDLDVLDEEDSIRFLLEHTADRRTERADDRDVAAKIAHHLDGLALALEQAAAWVRKDRRTLAAYLADWEKTHARLHAEYGGNWVGDYPRSLFTTYHTSVSQLTEDARTLLRLLSWIAPEPMPMRAIEKIGTLADPRTVLVQLADLHLARLTPDGENATVHRMLQSITQAEQGEAKPPALIAALGWIDGEMPTETDDVRTWPVALPLTPHAIAAANAGADRDISDPSGRLLNQAALLLNARADHRGAEPLMRRALAIWEDSLGKAHPHVAVGLAVLAQLLQATNRLGEAEPLMRRALAIDEASFGRDHPDVARDLNNLAQLLQATNRLGEAEPLMRRMVGIFLQFTRETGHRHPHLMGALNNYRVLLMAMGDSEDMAVGKVRALAQEFGVAG